VTHVTSGGPRNPAQSIHLHEGAAASRHNFREEIVFPLMRINAMKKTLILSTMVLAMSGMAAAGDLAADPIYKAKCAMCHGAAGEGKAAMKTEPLKNAAAKPEADLLAAMNKGKGKMPGYEAKLKPEEIKALVASIKALK
jgi:cytochrome c553